MSASGTRLAFDVPASGSAGAEDLAGWAEDLAGWAEDLTGSAEDLSSWAEDLEGLAEDLAGWAGSGDLSTLLSSTEIS